ncbi:CRISPR-associated protein, TM1812 family [Fibrobacter succinogenes subsp. succinogenes S85]|uniref:CRISPR-associated protein, TM1812 family n=1 Tax=Fibrobacter succinogenes (strain ATCC 19169 / S85) TaxID=59374 RepID=C9RRG7_FIBSS|nr:TIGR02221 family CRISPR-associated protein [Fibrobacter succinogenes]ACX75153.1 CRISPR-associated protein, TM1812 family [Fibrobacter succinogenes subsp. succinogenes S85]ADL27075.1 CRISPR-associated protein, TM1812 family [Fibrobacter succinogenes subsp. succinogenes S85]
MSRKIFVSFLGLTDYKLAVYKSWRGEGCASETRFVQKAIVELYPKTDLDKIVIFVTKESREKNEQALLEDLKELGVEPEKIETELISVDVSDLSLTWNWFESLQSKFEKGDTLVLDVTHGFRMVPVVFSAAVAYLKRVKNVHLESVLYGAFEMKVDAKPIVNLKDFYTISDWTEGVGRLVDTADASFLRKTAESESNGSFAGLNNQDLLNSIDDLTKAFRNVELQNIESKARKSLDLICKFQKQSSGKLEGQVLQMIIDQFQPLVSEPPLDGSYSLDYLKLQLRLIKMFAEYNLYMQAFTAMNEWLGSLGVFLMKRGSEFRFTSREKDSSARSHAAVFLNMLQHPADFEAENETIAMLKASLDEAYNTLFEKYTTQDEISDLLKQSKKIRNGFNHGWTGVHRKGAPKDLNEKFDRAMATLNRIVEKIGDDNG